MTTEQPLEADAEDSDVIELEPHNFMGDTPIWDEMLSPYLGWYDFEVKDSTERIVAILEMGKPVTTTEKALEIDL